MDYQEPSPGTYRLGRGIRIVSQQAICAYPLRVMQVSHTAARLLELCKEERTAEELAHTLSLPARRIELLCERLRWKGLLEAGPKRVPVSWPEVSIIIPSYNRASQLERCLRGLLELDYPPASIEVIVVDDASTDGTGEMLERLSEGFTVRGIVMRTMRHERQMGAAQARNTGAGVAQKELLAYIDSDCVPSRAWLKELVPSFEDAEIGIVGGMIRAYGCRNMLARYEDVRSSLFMGVRSQQVKLEGPLTYVPTASMLVRKSAWARVGGFAPLTFGEDVDFCHRVLLTGAKGLYEPRGIVYHDYRTRWWTFLKIRAAYASAEAVLQKRGEEETAPSSVESGCAAISPHRRGRDACHRLVAHLFPILLANPLPANFVGRGGRSPSGCQANRRPIRLPSDPVGERPPGSNDHNVRQQHLFPSLQSDGKHRSHDGERASTKKMANNRRILVLPVEQGLFAGLLVGGLWRWLLKRSLAGFLWYCLAMSAFVLLGTGRRFTKVRRRGVPLGWWTVSVGTTRGYLAYVYHLSRHVTRYYTLPLLGLGLIMPPLLLFLALLCGIVMGVDYVRLRPKLGLAAYAVCALLDDCAYEVGVCIGCVKERTWKPLVPVVRRRVE